MNEPDALNPGLIVVIGHTAAGKTSLAAHLAVRLNGEVISADSRQVYRGMDIGTGKDLDDYTVGQVTVPFHLIDLVDAGEKYSLFDFYRDFHQAYADIISRGKVPILCGGTGLYVESVLKGYQLTEVPVNEPLRESWKLKSDAELTDQLRAIKPLHNQSDTSSRERLERALEIALSGHPDENLVYPPIQAQVFGISFETETRRQRITDRLIQRLSSGMIAEVEILLESVPSEDLIYYGLEYKYLTQFCLGTLSREEMFRQLNTAIHQFAKRQMTWFRGMERRGIPITWIPGEWPLNQKIDRILSSLL